MEGLGFMAYGRESEFQLNHCLREFEAVQGRTCYVVKQEGEILSQLPGAELSGISDEALEAIEEGGFEGLARVISAIGLSGDLFVVSRGRGM